MSKSKTKPNAETYAAEFSRWQADDRGPYDAPGYSEDPRAALAFVDEVRHGVMPADEYWLGDASDRNILSGEDEKYNYAINGGSRAYFHGPFTGEGDPGAQRISDVFTVLSSGDDPITGESTLVIRSIDARGAVRTIAIPRGVIAAGDRTLAAFCQERGFVVTNSKALRYKFQNVLSALFGPQLILPDRSGWVGKKLAFVLPSGEVIGDDSKSRVYFNPGRTREARVGTAGSYAEWSNTVSTLVPGNSRFELAVCAAFVSPLMEFYKRVQPTIINIYGETTRGKSIAGFLFGSVWGGNADDRLGFAHSWNQTENSTMALAASHSGIGLALDELKLCAKPGRIGYVFSEGEERGRLNSESEQRHRRKWRSILMSNGELRLGELIAEASTGDTVSSGQEARCIDIPVDGASSIQGVVENLNGAPSTAHVVEELERMTRKHFGHAGPTFVTALIPTIEKMGRGEFENWLEDQCEGFVAKLEIPGDADPIIRRVALVFALIAVAGAIAVSGNILPIPMERVTAGVTACFKDWLAARGSVKKTTAQRTAIVSLRNYISTNRLQFINLDTHVHERRVVGKVIGYVKKLQGDAFYMLTSEAWNEVNSKARRGSLFEQLAEAELILSGEGGRRQYKLHFVDASGVRTQERVYAVSSRIDEVSDDGVFDNGTQTWDAKTGSWRDASGRVVGEAEKSTVKKAATKKARATPKDTDARYMAMFGIRNDGDDDALQH